MSYTYTLEACENVALISFKTIPYEFGVLSDIFNRVSDAGVVIDMISQTVPLSGSVSISFSCDDKDMVKILRIANELESNQQSKPLVSTGNCKLTLRSGEMRVAHGIFARVLKCLKNASSELLQVTTSETEISLLVPMSHMEDAVAEISAEFGIAPTK